MKALVTGGTGFLGGAVARRLRDSGADVVAVGRNRAAGERLEELGIRFHRIDLADASQTRSACQGRDLVFHCGALSSPWGRYRDFYASNVAGTENVIQGCMAQGVRRLVHVSTCAVYFCHQDRFDIKETDPLPPKPANAYARTKLLAEQAIDRAHEAGLPVVTVRPRAIFGPGDQTIFPRITRALQTGRLRILGDGHTVTDLVYVDNVVDAMLLCAESPDSTLGEKYNITNGEPVLVWSMIETLCQRLALKPPQRKVPYRVAYWLAFGMEMISKTLLLGREPVLTRYGVGLLAKSMTLNIDRARKDLDYVPRISIDEGLDRFVRWWQEEQACQSR